jgi:hypothetical protein
VILILFRTLASQLVVLVDARKGSFPIALRLLPPFDFPGIHNNENAMNIVNRINRGRNWLPTMPLAAALVFAGVSTLATAAINVGASGGGIVRVNAGGIGRIPINGSTCNTYPEAPC